MSAIDWTRPVRTQHSLPLIGILMPDRGASNKRRLALPSLSKEKPQEHLSYFLYPDSGVSRCDGASSEYDLVNYDPAMGDAGLKLIPEVFGARS